MDNDINKTDVGNETIRIGKSEYNIYRTNTDSFYCYHKLGITSVLLGDKLIRLIEETNGAFDGTYCYIYRDGQ